MKKMGHVLFGLTSLVFGFAYSVAMNLLAADMVKLSLLPVLVAGLLFLVLLYAVFFAVKLLKSGGDAVCTVKVAGKLPAAVWAFLLLTAVYTLCYLAYFPGPAVNDSLMIYSNGMMMARNSPVLYCLFISVFSKLGQLLGNHQLGVALCNVFQMLLVCAMSAWIVGWVYGKQLPRPIKVLVLLNFLLNPLLIIYSFTMIKDTVFSVGLVVLFLISYDIIIENKASFVQWCIMALDILLILSFRNGVNYMLVVYLVLLVFAVKNKAVLKKALVIILACLVSTQLACSALEKRFDIEYYSKEMLAIPIQQLSAVVSADGELTEEQEKVISGMMPLDDIKAKYTPYNVDAIKWDIIFNDRYVNENLPDILKVWLELFPKNAATYTKAYLWETFWFWAPIQQGNVKIFETVMDLEPAWHEMTGIADAPLLPEGITGALKSYCGLGQHFLREGVLFWCMLFFLLESYALSGDWRIFIVYSLCLLQWAVLMVSTPVFHSIRYVLCYVYGLPVYVAMLFLVKNPGQKII